MAWFPFDWIVLWAENASISDNFHRWLGLLTLLRMVCPWLGSNFSYCYHHPVSAPSLYFQQNPMSSFVLPWNMVAAVASQQSEDKTLCIVHCLLGDCLAEAASTDPMQITVAVNSRICSLHAALMRM